MIQLLIGLVVMLLVAAMAVPAYRQVIGKAAQESAAAEMKVIAHRIEMYAEHHGDLPKDLEAVGLPDAKDPWGRNYIYLPVREAPVEGGKADRLSVGNVAAFAPLESKKAFELAAMTDARNLHDLLRLRGARLSSRERSTLQRCYADGSRLNTDFDLFSAGPDGKTRPRITSAMSADDLVRAQDGHYFGPAEGL